MRNENYQYREPDAEEFQLKEMSTPEEERKELRETLSLTDDRTRKLTHTSRASSKLIRESIADMVKVFLVIVIIGLISAIIGPQMWRSLSNFIFYQSLELRGIVVAFLPSYEYYTHQKLFDQIMALIEPPIIEFTDEGYPRSEVLESFSPVPVPLYSSEMRRSVRLRFKDGLKWNFGKTLSARDLFYAYNTIMSKPELPIAKTLHRHIQRIVQAGNEVIITYTYPHTMIYLPFNFALPSKEKLSFKIVTLQPSIYFYPDLLRYSYGPYNLKESKFLDFFPENSRTSLKVTNIVLNPNSGTSTPITVLIIPSTELLRNLITDSKLHLLILSLEEYLNLEEDLKVDSRYKVITAPSWQQVALLMNSKLAPTTREWLAYKLKEKQKYLTDLGNLQLYPSNSILPVTHYAYIEYIPSESTSSESSQPSLKPNFKGQLKLYILNSSKLHHKLAEKIAEILKPDLDVKVTPLPADEFSRELKGNNFQLALVSYTLTPYQIPSRSLAPYLEAFGLNDPQLSELETRIESATNLIAQQVLYKKFQIIYWKRKLLIPIATLPRVFIVSTRLEGFKPKGYGYLLRTAQNWYLKTP